MNNLLKGFTLTLMLLALSSPIYALNASLGSDSDQDGREDGTATHLTGNPLITIEPASLLIDRGHSGDFNIGGLVTYLLEQGWTVNELHDPVTPEALAAYDVYLIPTKIGTNETIDQYTQDEALAVMAFVANGKGLWCFAEYNGNQTGVNSVASQFGIEFQSSLITDPVNNVNGNENWPLITNIGMHPISAGVGSFGFIAGCCVGTSAMSTVVATCGPNASSVECPNMPPVISVYENGGRAVFCGDITPLYPNFDITEEHWLMLANTAEWLAVNQSVETEDMSWDNIKSLYR